MSGLPKRLGVFDEYYWGCMGFAFTHILCFLEFGAWLRPDIDRYSVVEAHFFCTSFYFYAAINRCTIRPTYKDILNSQPM